LREGLFGNTDKAREQIRVARPLPSEGDPYYGFALALAYAGNANGVQRLVEDFNKRFPEDTTVQYLPTLRAKLALMHSNPQDALTRSRATLPRAAPRIKISSHSGKTPIPTFLYCSKPRQNTRSCSSSVTTLENVGSCAYYNPRDNQPF